MSTLSKIYTIDELKESNLKVIDNSTQKELKLPDSKDQYYEELPRSVTISSKTEMATYLGESGLFLQISKIDINPKDEGTVSPSYIALITAMGTCLLRSLDISEMFNLLCTIFLIGITVYVIFHVLNKIIKS